MLIQQVGDALERTELLSAGGVLLAAAEGRRREALVAVELVSTVRKLRQRLFPAYAGVILGHILAALMPTTFPRIRGGDPGCRLLGRNVRFFSPHTWG